MGAISRRNLAELLNGMGLNCPHWIPFLGESLFTVGIDGLCHVAGLVENQDLSLPVGCRRPPVMVNRHQVVRDSAVDVRQRPCEDAFQLALNRRKVDRGKRCDALPDLGAVVEEEDYEGGRKIEPFSVLRQCQDALEIGVWIVLGIQRWVGD